MDVHRPSNALFDVYLRLRPSNADRERFLDVEVNEQSEPTHITIRPPANDTRRRAVERFAFTRVFEERAGQRELFESTGAVQLVEGVLGAAGREGRDGLLATLGVTGSGKSHTILGSRTQRGLTQLTLDVLFQHVEPYLAGVETSDATYSSLCATDISEGQLLPAAHFLDQLYGNGDITRMSRATTPAFVRNLSPLPSTALPGTFPTITEEPDNSSEDVYDRLYPSLHKYLPISSPNTSRLCRSPSKSSTGHVILLARSISKLTHSIQESSFLSGPAPSTRRVVPRISALPQSPAIDDIGIEFDSSAEYAIVVSMYEVYNDKIFDLLTGHVASGKDPAKRRNLLFKHTPASPNQKVVTGLKKIICSSLEEALLVLETGLLDRKETGTASNAQSSRSHGFFCLDVKKRNRGRGIPGAWKSSTMTIVDLAGSERARNAKTAGATLAEAGKINESLMYLGQCMQIQADNAHTLSPQTVPFRRCKLTELLFSNSFAPAGQHAKSPQKATMIVTADPLGDYNATTQILRYSALAKEITVPRIPSVTSTILSGVAARHSRPTTPSAVTEELEAALAEVDRLKQELEVEMGRRIQAEASWAASEQCKDDLEAEIREEVFAEMEAQMLTEQRRWRAARDEELDRADEHLDRKLDILQRGIEVYEDADEDKENYAPSTSNAMAGLSVGIAKLEVNTSALEEENARLRERLASVEREKGLRSPSKKMRVLKTRKWDGSGMGLDDDI